MSITYSQAVSYAQQAGFSNGSEYVIAAIAEAESGLNPNATNCNNPGGSCDRGIVQINSYWHSEVSNQCAYDPACAFQQAYRISSNGTNFSQWTTFQNGQYKQYLNATTQALSSVGGAITGTSQSSSQSSSSSTSSTDAVSQVIGSIYGSSQVRNTALMFVAIVVVVIGLVLVFR